MQAWRIMGDNRGMQLLPTRMCPGTVWDAFQASGSGADGSTKPGLAGAAGPLPF